jgi:hypothetical protein
MNPAEQGCLLCRHWVPQQQEDWKPSYAGERYDYKDARASILATERHIKGQCALHPVWSPAGSAHYCWQLEPQDRQEGVSAKDFIHGTWQTRQSKEQEKQIAELKRQLAVSRKTSASRLARLTARRNGRDAAAHVDEADAS